MEEPTKKGPSLKKVGRFAIQKKSTLRAKKINVSNFFVGKETSSYFELGTRKRISICILLLSEKRGNIWVSRQFPNFDYW